MYLTKLLSSGWRNSTNQLIYVLFSDVTCCPLLCIKMYCSLFPTVCLQTCLLLPFHGRCSQPAGGCAPFIHAALLSAWCFLQHFSDLSGARGRRTLFCAQKSVSRHELISTFSFSWKFLHLFPLHKVPLQTFAHALGLSSCSWACLLCSPQSLVQWRESCPALEISLLVSASSCLVSSLEWKYFSPKKQPSSHLCFCNATSATFWQVLRRPVFL